MAKQDIEDTNLAQSDEPFDVLNLRFRRIAVLIDHLTHNVMERKDDARGIEETVLFLNSEVHETREELDRIL